MVNYFPQESSNADVCQGSKYASALTSEIFEVLLNNHLKFSKSDVSTFFKDQETSIKYKPRNL